MALNSRQGTLKSQMHGVFTMINVCRVRKAITLEDDEITDPIICASPCALLSTRWDAMQGTNDTILVHPGILLTALQIVLMAMFACRATILPLMRLLTLAAKLL
eukprot:SAG31_NODE_3168_length_4593_cov_205.949933_3_plen_104_part_00